jgi:hypothetical protein
LSNKAALGPWSTGVDVVEDCLDTGSAGDPTACRVVTPPDAEDVNVGTGCPFGASGLPSDRAAAIRFARGTYGVYVVCGSAFGCCGGGRIGPARCGGGGSGVCVLGAAAGGRGGEETAAARRAEREEPANEEPGMVGDVGEVGRETTLEAGEPVSEEDAEEVEEEMVDEAAIESG